MRWGSADIPDPTCGALLPALEGFEKRPALWDSRNRRQFLRAELRAEALSLATALKSDRKKLVFVLAANHSSSVIGLLGAAAAGHAVALIDPLLPADKQARLAEAYRPDVVLSTNEVDGSLKVVFASEAVGADRQGSQDPALAMDSIHADLMLLLSTSGTTGSSKFVRLSHDAVVANARQISTVLKIDRDSVAIAHLPLHYSYGLSVVTSHLSVGGSVAVIDEAVTSGDFWIKVADGGGTHFPGVPFHYTALVRLGFHLVPPSVNVFTQAGGALDPRMQAAVHGEAVKRKTRFYVMYGQTEAAPRMTTLPHECWEAKAGSVGQALPAARLTILDEHGRRLDSPDDVGAVVYEGANVMMGYAEQRSDLARGDVMGGRLETGDLGRLDSEGFLFLAGRKVRFTKIAGLRLGLEEIERDIAAIMPACCVESGDKIAVCVEGAAEPELKGFLRSLCTSYKIPPNSFKVIELGEFPRLASGKVDLPKLKDTAGVR